MKKLVYKLSNCNQIYFYYEDKVVFHSYESIRLGGDENEKWKYTLEYNGNVILQQELTNMKKHLLYINKEFRKLGFYVDLTSLLEEIIIKKRNLIIENIEQLNNIYSEIESEIFELEIKLINTKNKIDKYKKEYYNKIYEK
jgi:hypothetical protein